MRRFASGVPKCRVLMPDYRVVFIPDCLSGDSTLAHRAD
jgi:hypothetical protein